MHAQHAPRGVAEEKSENAPAQLSARYRQVRKATEELASPLTPEDCCIQSMPDVSPTKWHLAHTTWFWETFVLEKEVAGYEPFHPRFRYLFNSYYEQVGAQYPRPHRGLLSRPGLDEVHRYRAHVDRHLTAFLAGETFDAALHAPIIQLGLNHEQQHQELLLTDILHVFSCHPDVPVYRETTDPPRRETAPLRWIPFSDGVRAIGHAGPGFAFDNEGPRHRQIVPAFEIASRAVTGGEYREFIEDGGYRRSELWLSDGWRHLSDVGWRAPLYWSESARDLRMITLSGRREVDPAAPVTHLSYYEADAYARWAGARLPTEAEWECAAAEVPLRGNFLESGHGHPLAVLSGDEPERHPLQMFGDVWEWTGSPYVPYPGYRPASGAIGEYNGKFMCNQMVLRGGSCVTPRGHVRRSYRNFFPPTARWQFSGLRLARDA